MEPDSEFIESYLELYSETQGVLPEKLEQFGETYRQQGYLTREQLYEIAYESSTRSAYHVKDNKEEHCRQVTRNVRKVDGDLSKIALIESLKGFKAPTASCVLAALDPEKHAVVDTRVWASLERLDYFEERRESFDARDYAEMMPHIRQIAERTGFSAAEVGYALFAHDFDVREGKLH
ncbi:MAG: hypothetical protein ABEJ66_00250 [Candidatus Nanohaloarchaea archaeon]